MDFYKDSKENIVVILNNENGMISFIGNDGIGKFAVMGMLEENFHKMYHKASIPENSMLYEAIYEEVIKNIILREKVKELEKKIRELKLELEIKKVLVNNKRQNQWIVGDVIEGRVAKCSYCGKMLLSETTLPFFRHNPDNPLDEFYCGCKGWD